MTVHSLQAQALRGAIAALDGLRGSEAEEDKKAMLNAVRDLPLLLRRHGLLATLGHGMNSGDAVAKTVADAFAKALGELCGQAGGVSARHVVNGLATASLHVYLQRSRLALILADAWVGVAESLLSSRAPEDAGAAANAEGQELPTERVAVEANDAAR